MNNQTMLTQGKGGHCPTLGFGFPVAFLVPVWGRSFFLEFTQPNVNTGYNRNNKNGRGKNGSNPFHIHLLHLEANLLASQPILHHRLPFVWLR